MTDTLSFLLWYLLVTAVGLLAFPLAYRLLPNLPDRGYALARALGLLLWGYGFWLLASFRILVNTPGGILLALMLVGGLSGLALAGRWKEFTGWLAEHRRQIVASEILFLVLFAVWAVVRSMNPDISGTEKPMEQAFINAILRSPTFPPQDPWLSGYAISYYYFGYVLVAMLAKLTGITSGVAFNLAMALWFALTALGAYGVLYNLLSLKFVGRDGKGNLLARSWALFAPAFLLIVSNVEGFLEMLHARGLFWTQTASGGASGFWKWIDLQELVNPPSSPLTWIPNRPGGIWWWRASRVVSDYTLKGDYKEVIDEFPFFSYLLADLHPHVLAMPFDLLAVSLALNFYLHARQRLLPAMGLAHWLRLWTRESAPSFWGETRLGAWFRTPGFWLAAVVLGAMAFVNTWDFPIYVALFGAAYALARFEQDGWSLARVGDLLEIMILLIIAGAVLYLPFYFGFQSQAGGILPSLSFFTRGIHFWIMFGSLLVPVSIWLIWLWIKRGGRISLMNGLKFAGLAVFGLWALSYLFAGLITVILAAVPRFGELATLFYNLQGSNSALGLLAGSMMRRLEQPGAWLALFVLLVLVWGVLSTLRKRQGNPEAIEIGTSEGEAPALDQPDEEHSADAFVLLLVLLGAGLVLFPEFFYLRDQFGSRMNTIFKFYFQSWLVLSLAAAFATTMIWKAMRSRWSWLGRVAWAAVLVMALAYPAFGLWDKTDHFNTSDLTLNGNRYFERSEPDEADAIYWLRSAPAGVVAEAIGGQYSAFARVSELSGQPAVLGWPGHESQWRGGSKEMGTRESDIETLYRSNDWNQVIEIIKKYNIHYIYVGSLERSSYGIQADKFQAHLQPVYQNKSVIIYEVPDLELLQPAAGG